MSDPNNSACTMTNPCQTEALEYAISNQSKTQTLQDFITSLQTSGVEIASENWVDLENDGKNELLFTVTPPAHIYYNLWIASDYPNGIQTFQAGAFPIANPEFNIETIAPGRSLIKLGLPRNLLWTRDPITNEPTLGSLYEWQNPNDTTDYLAVNTDLKEFEQLQSQLYSSNNFTSIYDKLLIIANHYDTCPYLLNDLTTNFYKFEGGNYYYTIGFVAELVNDKDIAQKMYAKIVDQYPSHPMAALAREKINP